MKNSIGLLGFVFLLAFLTQCADKPPASVGRTLQQTNDQGGEGTEWNPQSSDAMNGGTADPYSADKTDNSDSTKDTQPNDAGGKDKDSGSNDKEDDGENNATEDEPKPTPPPTGLKLSGLISGGCVVTGTVPGFAKDCSKSVTCWGGATFKTGKIRSGEIRSANCPANTIVQAGIFEKFYEEDGFVYSCSGQSLCIHK